MTILTKSGVTIAIYTFKKKKSRFSVTTTLNTKVQMIQSVFEDEDPK